MHTIRAIFFDYGAVLNFADFDTFHKDVLGLVFNRDNSPNIEQRLRRRMDIGDLTFDEYFNEVSEKCNLKLSPKEYVRLARRNSRENKDLLGFLKTIKDKYNLYVLSNNSEMFIDSTIKQSLSYIFKEQFYSHELKIRKPELPIYHHAVNNSGFLVEECLFVDDKERNVVAARKIGMKAMQYTSFPNLKIELEKIGIRADK